MANAILKSFAAAAVLTTVGATPALCQTEAVVWTSAVGVSVSGNSLTKTAATGWGNAGAVSTRAIASGDGYVEFVASATTSRRIVGLSNGDSNQSYTDVDFAVLLYSDGSVQGVRRR
jgi:hypothetical protein